MDFERMIQVIEGITKEFDVTERKLICCMLFDTIAADEDAPVGEIYDQMKTMAVQIEKDYGKFII